MIVKITPLGRTLALDYHTLTVVIGVLHPSPRPGIMGSSGHLKKENAYTIKMYRRYYKKIHTYQVCLEPR
jgi:hypothetical protein